MPEKDPTAISLLTYSWVFIVSALGGVASYINKRRQGMIERYSITEFVGELVTSCFSGLITFYLCEAAKVDPMLSAALIGISGHMGSRAIFMFEKYLQQRFHPKQ